ncbi:MAG: hypothetical protein NZ960_01590 [Candidatus Kapabacteria bacterium]|nr:hypothetical protein [Candidatus Kapabacteria bacterium]MDW8011719.1 DUF4149 domain-containing protein [Bacteroidota bacterium]
MNRWRLFGSLLAFYAGITLWVGSLGVFGIAVAGVPFEVLSRDTAGVVNRLILARLHVLEIAGILLVGTGLWLLNLRLRGWQWRLGLVAFVVMVTLFGIYAGLLEPLMNSIARAVSFDNPTPETLAAIARFEGYHRLYSLLAGLTVTCGVALFGWQTWLVVRLLMPSRDAAAGDGAQRS